MKPLPTLGDRIENAVLRMPWSGCWLWMSSVGKAGYGNLDVDGKKVSAHRVVWSHFRGAIAKGQCVLHKCDIPCCVNPDHLFLGSMSDNTQDMIRKGRHVAHRRESGLCKRGHQLTEKPANHGKGRWCLTCRSHSWLFRKQEAKSVREAK